MRVTEASKVSQQYKNTFNPHSNIMFKIFTAAAIAISGVIVAPTHANAANMSCYGSEYMQTCTYSEWVNGEYVTCYGTITKYSKNWNCY